MRLVQLMIGSAAMLFAAGAVAQTASPAIRSAIETRQANYKAIGKNFKAVNDELKSGSPNAATVRQATQEIARIAPLQQKLFPAGSGPQSGIKTDAKPNIWTENAEFVRLQNDFVQKANALNAVAAAGNMAALGGGVRELGGACKACHDRFRQDDD